jgi:5-methylcytosine-specific restriction endonuclease McrA
VTEPERTADGLGFAQLLLTLLDEGRRSATYKLAVLLALLDCCALGTDGSGRAPDAILTRDLARRVLELYWPQVRDYAGPDGSSLVLRQSSSPRAVTVEAVAQLRAEARALGARTPAAAERRLPGAYARAVDAIELNLVQMPLGRLQRPAGFSATANADYPRFLYDDAPFSERVTGRRLREAPMRVALRPGVADWLIGLTGLLRPLIELYWTREVARFNRVQLPEDGLRDFLFGSERESLARLRPGLLDAQDGGCFYCGARLAAVEVDHFVPWSRVPNDGLANLVLTDRRCNGSKRDAYADLPLLERWAARPQDVLRQVADDAGWPLRGPESRRIARGLYAHLPAGTPLWQRPGVFTVLDRARLPSALAHLEER